MSVSRNDLVAFVFIPKVLIETITVDFQIFGAQSINNKETLEVSQTCSSWA